MNGKSAASTGLTLLAALSLSSCVTLHGNAQPRQANCNNDDDCKVVVSVDCGTFTCKASVNVDELNLKGNNARWELSDGALKSGYEFQPVYGVWFKTPAGQRDFDCKLTAKVFKCRTKPHSPSGARYPYGVQIIGPKPVLLLDPWIVN